MARNRKDVQLGRRVSSAVVAAMAASMASGALADGHAVAAKAGILGLGAEYGLSIGERWAVRVGWHGSQLGFDAEEAGIDYELDLVWDSLSLGVDFHPTGGPLRVFGGLLRNDNRFDARSVLGDRITIGDTTYDAADVGALVGRVDFDDRAPFIGVGWDWSRRGARRVGVSFDVGVVKQGRPRVLLSATGPIAGFPQFDDDIAAEEAELREAIEDFDLLPFATVGIVFRF